MIAVLKKELRSYFTTPIGYIFMGVFLLIGGLLFSLSNIFSMNSDYSSFLSSMIMIFLLVVPLLTMKIFSDEKRLKTDQLLLTAPISTGGIVVGKYFAALLVFLFTLIITFLYPLLLSFHGRIDLSQIVGTYIGFFLLGASFISVGVFVSSLTESQASAAILTFCILLITWIIDFIGAVMPQSPLSGWIFTLVIGALVLLWLYNATGSKKAALMGAIVLIIILGTLFLVHKEIFANLIIKTLTWFSLTKRFSFFPMGVLKLSAITYYISFCGFFLFLTSQKIEKQRWS